MKRVLIITYYWPPSGGSGVQRWLRFSGHLRSVGWEPVIATVANPEYPVIDPSLADCIPQDLETLRLPIWEPYQLYKKFTGQRRGARVAPGLVEQDRKPRKREQLARWIRGNLFIPDARRFWIRPSVRRLRDYLRENRVEAMVTTGPPMSVHLIGHGLKQDLDLPWLADFRDPWTNVFYLDGYRPSGYARRRQARLEARVLDSVDHVTVVGPTMSADLQPKARSPVSVVTNGFEPDEYESLEPSQDGFRIAVVGTLMRSQNCPALWRVLRKLVDESSDFARELSIGFTGMTDREVRADVERHGLADYLDVSDYVPYAQVSAEHRRAQVLLLPINVGENTRCIITGKLFGYLGSRRPILCIGQEDGDAAAIIRTTGAGLIADHEDEATIEAHVRALYERYRQGGGPWPSHDIDAYAWASQTRRVGAILDGIVAAEQAGLDG